MGLFFNDIVINIGSGNDKSVRSTNASSMNLTSVGSKGNKPLATVDTLYQAQQGYNSFSDFLENKVAPEDLRNYQEIFLNICKKEGIKSIYVDNKHKKKYSGAYIASYKETTHTQITDLITEILNKILNDPKFLEKEQKLLGIIPTKSRSKYNFAILREEPVGSNKVYVIILTPKSFDEGYYSYDSNIIYEGDLLGGNRKKYNKCADVKINSSDLNKIRDHLFENIKKEDPKLERHIYMDNTHKKDLSGCYICTFSNKDTADSSMGNFLKKMVVVFLFGLIGLTGTILADSHRLGKVEKHGNNVIINDKYKLLVIIDPFNDGLSYANYILLAVPKDFDL